MLEERLEVPGCPRWRVSIAARLTGWSVAPVEVGGELCAPADQSPGRGGRGRRPSRRRIGRTRRARGRTAAWPGAVAGSPGSRSCRARVQPPAGLVRRRSPGSVTPAASSSRPLTADPPPAHSPRRSSARHTLLARGSRPGRVPSEEGVCRRPQRVGTGRFSRATQLLQKDSVLSPDRAEALAWAPTSVTVGVMVDRRSRAMRRSCLVALLAGRRRQLVRAVARTWYRRRGPFAQGCLRAPDRSAGPVCGRPARGPARLHVGSGRLGVARPVPTRGPRRRSSHLGPRRDDRRAGAPARSRRRGHVLRDHLAAADRARLRARAAVREALVICDAALRVAWMRWASGRRRDWPAAKEQRLSCRRRSDRRPG